MKTGSGRDSWQRPASPRMDVVECPGTIADCSTVQYDRHQHTHADMDAVSPWRKPIYRSNKWYHVPVQKLGLSKIKSKPLKAILSNSNVQNYTTTVHILYDKTRPTVFGAAPHPKKLKTQNGS